MSVDAGFEVASAYVTLLIADGDFEAMVTEKIEAACAVGGANGGDVLTQELAAAAAKGGDEVESALLEAVAGSGDAMAAQIGDGLTSGLVEAAGRAGDEAGIEAGDSFTAEFEASTAGVGTDLGERLVAGVDQVAPHVAQVATGAVGQAFAAGMADTLASSALEAGALSKLTANLSDAAAEAGGAAGDSLIAALGDSATQGAGRAAAQVAAGIEAPLTDAAAQAGANAGSAFDAGFASSVDVAQAVEGALSEANVSEQLQAVGEQEATALASSVAEAVQGTMGSLIVTTGEFLSMSQDMIDAWLGRLGEEATGGDLEIFTTALQRINTDLTSGTAMTAAQQDAYESLWQSAKEEVDAYRAALEGASEAQLAMTEGMIQRSMTLGLPLGPQSLDQLLGGGTSGIGGGPAIYGIGTEEAAAVAAASRPIGVSVPGLAVASQSKAAAAGMQEVAAAASTAEGAVGGAAAAMGGPLMWGLLGVASMLPMLSGMFNSGSQAAQAYAQQQQQLGQAISKDSDMVGANTVATIANQLSTSGAADTLQGYGISLTDATAAMAGVKSAQKDVNGVLNEQIDNLNSLIQEQEAHSSGVNDEVQAEKQQVGQLEATREAMKQLERDVVTAVQNQNALTEATLNAEKAADVYNVQVRAGVLALEQQAQSAKVSADALGAYDMTLIPGSQAYTTAVNNQATALNNNAIQAHINADALNQSLAPQAQVSEDAIQAALNYQAASTATSQYTAALNGLYGQYGTTSGAQAAFTTALDGLKGKITAGKDAVDLNTQAGAKNFAQFQQVAQAAETYAEKLYQQTGDSQQATQALQQMAGKLDTAATKAGLTKDQVHQLNEELFGVQNASDITINLDPTPAEQQMKALDGFIQGEIADINNTTIAPHLGGIGGHYAVPARAEGGPVQAGQAYIVGERRAELFVPQQDGYVYPSLDEGRHAVAGAATNVHFNYYGTQHPTYEQRADMMRELAATVGVIG